MITHKIFPLALVLLISATTVFSVQITLKNKGKQEITRTGWGNKDQQLMRDNHLHQNLQPGASLTVNVPEDGKDYFYISDAKGAGSDWTAITSDTTYEIFGPYYLYKSQGGYNYYYEVKPIKK